MWELNLKATTLLLGGALAVSASEVRLTSWDRLPPGSAMVQVDDFKLSESVVSAVALRCLRLRTGLTGKSSCHRSKAAMQWLGFCQWNASDSESVSCVE